MKDFKISSINFEDFTDFTLQLPNSLVRTRFLASNLVGRWKDVMQDVNGERGKPMWKNPKVERAMPVPLHRIQL